MKAAVLLSLIATAPPAFAAPEVTMSESVGDYYGGEAVAAYAILGLSVASVAGGAYLITRDPDFARGLGWPLLTVGGLELIGSIVYAITVAGEVDHYLELLARDPQAFQKEELEHIQGTTDRFVFYRAIELALVAAGTGVAVFGAVSDRELFTGIGIGVVGVAFPVFVIDTFNQRRAVAYRDRLSAFSPSVQVGEQGWSIAIAGRF